MATFPPPFFVFKISLTKKEAGEPIEFNKMSSGERQFLFSMSTILYHIKNLMSVPNSNDRAKYKKFNIILDEIELCFHPEYQREFVNKLIGYLTRMTKDEKEKYFFNIILATHSPFILSDIPNCNIMYLEEGNQVNDKITVNPFGANIHDILHQSFFLENGFIGEFAAEKIRGIIETVNRKEKISKEQYDESISIIKLIGEPIIRNKLLMMLGDVYDNKKEFIEDEISLLQKELKDRQEKLRKINS